MKEEKNHSPRQLGSGGLKVTRREILTMGGAALVGITLGGVHTDLLGVVSGQTGFPGVTVLSGAKKPVYVALAGSRDPVAHSIADSLFWLDQEVEHAKFFLMHLPSPDLEPQRRLVQQLERQLVNQLSTTQRARVDRNSLPAFNRSTTALVRRFYDAKQNLMKAQDAGQLKSLAWPTFIEHVALEGDRFAKRLDRFSRGDVEFDRSEVVNFWTRIMGDHADFIAHVLDPKERALIETAMKSSETWREMKGRSNGKVEDTLEGYIAFKKKAQAGIDTGAVDGIIHPTLADHVLREALKFSDELKRVS